MSLFEVLMLICFGAAWPVSIYKSWKSKQNGGKSILFLFIVLTGYICGILHKVFFNFDLVILLYALNFIMVSIDMLLYLHNRKLAETTKEP